MTLSDYFKQKGRDALRDLAAAAGVSDGYLLGLIYQPERLPSTGLCKRLVDASGGLLTLDGLANPQKQLVGREGRSGRRVKSK